jgi:hypothetical protein
MKIIFEPQKRHFALPASYSIIPLERRSPLSLCEKKKQKTENRSINRNRKKERGGILISHLWIRCFKQKNSSF